jgi:hypothetical protein
MKSLGSDQGAVFLMATFAGLLLVALLMHVSGVGQAALEQATMQDAADATVLSAAAANARGMNIIALINMIMAAVLALVVGVAAGCAIPQTASLFCGFVSPANEVRSSLGDAADSYEDLAKQVLEQLHDASEKVSDVIPYVAQAEALAISSQAPYSPPAQGGVVWPFTQGLPTQEGSFEKLCRKAAEDAVRPVAMCFGDTLEPIVQTVLGTAIESLAGTFTDYFCAGGDSGGQDQSRPKEKLRREVGYPVGQTAKGERAQCASEFARVDSVTGQCGAAQLCRQCASMGCEDCFGKWSKKNYSFGLWTAVHDEWVEWTDEAGEHRLGLEPEATGGQWSLEQHRSNPCDSQYALSSTARRNCGSYFLGTSPWAPAAAGPSALPFEPICILETRKVVSAWERARYSAPSGAFLEHVTRKAYLVLSGCVLEEDIAVEAQGEPIAQNDEERSSMAPRELDVERFEAESTLRALVLGGRKAGRRLQGTNLFGHKASDKLGQRLSVAAAEYYSMDDYPESLWSMRWLSRLVRFSLEGATQGEDESSRQAQNLLGQGLLPHTGGHLDGAIDDYILH